jgi:hypothetical protein
MNGTEIGKIENKTMHERRERLRRFARMVVESLLISAALIATMR